MISLIHISGDDGFGKCFVAPAGFSITMHLAGMSLEQFRNDRTSILVKVTEQR